MKATCGESVEEVNPSFLCYGAVTKDVYWPATRFEAYTNPDNAALHNDMRANPGSYTFKLNGNTLVHLGPTEFEVTIGDWEYMVDIYIDRFKFAIQNINFTGGLPSPDDMTLEIWHGGELIDRTHFTRTSHSTSQSAGDEVFDDMTAVALSGGVFLGINPTLPNRGQTGVPVTVIIEDNR